MFHKSIELARLQHIKYLFPLIINKICLSSFLEIQSINILLEQCGQTNMVNRRKKLHKERKKERININ